MRTHKRSVSFTPPQLAWLTQRAQELGVTIAELVRRIIDEKREKSE